VSGRATGQHDGVSQEPDAAKTARANDADAPTLRVEAEEGSLLLVGIVRRLGVGRPRVLAAADALAALATRFSRHRGSVLAAGFAYFALLALVPAAIALGSVAAWIGDGDALRESLDRAVERAPGLEGPASEVLGGLIDVVDRTSGATFGWTTLIGLLIAIYAASRAFVTATHIIDLAYERPMRERSWLVQLIAAVLVLAVLVVVLVGAVILQALPSLQRTFGVPVWLDGRAVTALLLVGAGLSVLVVVGAALRFGAPGPRRPRWIGGGAVLATLIVVAGTAFTRLYVDLSSQFNAAVAVLGGVLVLLFWLYVVGLALVVGAEWEAVLLGRDRPSASANLNGTAAVGREGSTWSGSRPTTGRAD
jgi:membrane protein